MNSPAGQIKFNQISQVINKSKNTILAEQVVIAQAFFSRLIGLLNRKSLLKGQALVLIPSNAIHSFFMSFYFDALFLDKEKKVVGLISEFKPFRLSKIYRQAYMTIELPSGTLLSTQTQLGDQIELLP